MSGPRVELAMIVRNGGAALARCLRSALPAVDRVVIGDTGSTDDSVEVARSFGAHVFAVPWEDNFAKARNAVLAACRGEWVLILDDDEMLDPAGAAMIRPLAAQSAVDAWEVWRWNYIRTRSSRSGVEAARPNPYILEESRPYPAYTRHPNTLFFRRLSGVVFEHAVHETVSRRVRELGLRTAVAPFVIHHFGNAEDSEEERLRKLEHYHRIGQRKTELHPADDWAHYELGLSEFEYRRDPRAALRCFEQALRLNPGFGAAWLYAGICLGRLGRHAESLAALERAAAPDTKTGSHPVGTNPLLEEARGDAYFHGGDLSQAERHYRLAAVDGALSPLAASKLGACEVRLGRAADGLARIREAVESEPGAAELYGIWVAAALLAGDVVLAAEAAERRLGVGQAPMENFVMAAGLAARLNRWERAAELLAEGVRRHPEDETLRREWRLASERAGLLQPGKPD